MSRDLFLAIRGFSDFARMNDRVLDFIQSGDFRPPHTVTEQVLGNLPQATAEGSEAVTEES